MFENILFQETACAALKKDILEKTLSPALLLYGPPASAKTSLALELSRILTCCDSAAPGRWTCRCWSCTQGRELSQNHVLVLGSSGFRTEIKVCRKFFEQAWQNRLEEKQLRILLLIWLRSLHKILKRYDKVLWQDGKTEKQRKAQKALEEFLELLAKLSDVFANKPTGASKSGKGSIFRDKPQLERDMNRSEELAEILIAAIPQGIPVQQIRALQQWSRQTGESPKVAILENADAMNPAASNAMLKLLEEPPHNCFFVLTSRRKQALLPTVLSRLRPFALQERSAQEELIVVQKVFRAPQKTAGKGETLQELFCSGEQTGSELRLECEAFLHGLLEKQPFYTLKPGLGKLELEVFLNQLALVLQSKCLKEYTEAPNRQKPLFWYQHFLQLSRKALERHKIYHESALLLLQNLYLELLYAGQTRKGDPNRASDNRR